MITSFLRSFSLSFVLCWTIQPNLDSEQNEAEDLVILDIYLIAKRPRTEQPNP